MNKEYVYLSDTEILVTDELGNTKIRNIENTNIHEILLLENKLEEINEIIMELENIIKKEDKLELKQKNTLIQLMIPFIIGITSYGITCLINPSLLSFPNIISIALGTSISTIALDILALKFRKKQIKYINETKYTLAKANTLREEFEQQLSEIKKQSKYPNNSNENNKENPILRRNKTFFLEETPSLYEQISKIEEPKAKKRTLKKENKS